MYAGVRDPSSASHGRARGGRPRRRADDRPLRPRRPRQHDRRGRDRSWRRRTGSTRLVNNGGVGLRGAVEDCADEEIRRVFETNVLGTIAAHPGRAAAHAGRQLRADRHRHLGRRARARLRRLDLLREQVRAGRAGRGAGARARAVRDPVDPGRARDRSRPSAGPRIAGRRAARRTRAGRTTACSGPARPWRTSIVARSPTRPADVARTIHAALTDEKPRLRYVVGRGASVVIFLRRHLPEPVFERLYFGGQLRRVERAADRSAIAEGAR